MIALSLIVPCYNEEEALPETCTRLLGILSALTTAGKISANSYIYFVDDGSKDKTWDLIETWAGATKSVRGIKLSRNRGHQHALLAGLLSASGDLVISIDADLQDDVSAIPLMLDEYAAGADIVYGVRDDRTADSFVKRLTAESFYKLLRTFGVEVVYNHADYRALSRNAIEALRRYKEINLYIRGLIPLIGFKSSVVTYKRHARIVGLSKYPLRKMISLAWEGITALSIAPLRFVTATGIIVFLISIVLSLFVLAIRIFTERALPGWASTVLPIYVLGGIQILCLGIIGEYLGKVYKEVKARPRYIIEKTTFNEPLPNVNDVI